MTRDPFEMVAQAAAGCPPDPEIWAWFCAGCRGKQHGLDMEAALGMGHAGRVRRRNVELRAAAEALRAGREMSDNDLAGELAARLQRFTVDKLPRYWRTGDVSTFDDVEHRLLAAALSGAPTTSSKKNLYRIIKRDVDKDSLGLSRQPVEDGIHQTTKGNPP